MKKILFALMAGYIPALLATNVASAQNSVNTEVLEPQKNSVAIEKATAENERTIALAGISPRAIKDFAKKYKDVNGESWEKISDGFSAKYVTNGIISRIYYGTNGRWTGSLKGYTEDKMPPDVRKIVKREYYDFIITYVQEAETLDSNGTPTYIIQVEDKNSIKLVRVYDGQMDVWKEYKKQS